MALVWSRGRRGTKAAMATLLRAQANDPTMAPDVKPPNLRVVGSKTLRPRAGSPPQATTSPDDAELLAAVRANDAGAATAFHDRVRRQVDRTILRLLGRRDTDHEDLVQLSLIELIYSVGRFRGDCSLDSWTSAVTAHVVSKHLRRRGTERRIFAPPPLSELAGSAPGPSSEVLLRSVVARVRIHLDRIVPAKAWAFLLHDVCGYDLREAAQIMNVSMAAAQQRLARGRRELHELIAADPELANWREGANE
jgi:RNA polymerase sigma-70 factor, ECF subfamily